jgi:hypothetical protein
LFVGVFKPRAPEPVEPATAIGSSDGPMQQKSRQRKVQMRLFDPPEVPLESIDEGTDVDWHDTQSMMSRSLGLHMTPKMNVL